MDIFQNPLGRQSPKMRTNPKNLKLSPQTQTLALSRLIWSTRFSNARVDNANILIQKQINAVNASTAFRSITFTLMLSVEKLNFKTWGICAKSTIFKRQKDGDWQGQRPPKVRVIIPILICEDRCKKGSSYLLSELWASTLASPFSISHFLLRLESATLGGPDRALFCGKQAWILSSWSTTLIEFPSLFLITDFYYFG